MKTKFRLSSGVVCLIIVLVIFGYLASVMGLANMLNTMMKTAHDLLLNTVFYIMAICVLTGALAKIFVDFGVVDLLQKLLRPIMKPLFNLPGVASLGAVMTFLSDNPAIITLANDKHFARYFKKYQMISLTNFGTAFGMGLIVIVFMISQGYFFAPIIGLVGAMIGCIISTRCMQHFICKDYPSYRTEDALSAEQMASLEHVKEEESTESGEQVSLFVRILNGLLDGGKSGVEIGLAIIPGVLIISTLVMMLTFGGSAQGVDTDGNSIVVYTGAAYEGTRLLPWLASKISFLFKWLFGFTAPELVAFPITALGAVGAALSLIPEFASQGIIDGNAIAVCTAMGMCWSGFLSTHAAMLDSLGYRALLSRAYLSHVIGGFAAGIATHWIYVGIMALASLFQAKEVYSVEADAWNCSATESHKVELKSMDDGTFVLKNWIGGACNEDVVFTVNAADSTINVKNAYAAEDGYYFVHINQKAAPGDPCYASIVPNNDYSEFAGDENSGYFYVWIFIHDSFKRLLDRGYYEITWGGSRRWADAAQEKISAEFEAEKAAEAEAEALKNGDFAAQIEILKSEIDELKGIVNNTEAEAASKE